MERGDARSWARECLAADDTPCTRGSLYGKYGRPQSIRMLKLKLKSQVQGVKHAYMRRQAGRLADRQAGRNEGRVSVGLAGWLAGWQEGWMDGLTVQRLHLIFEIGLTRIRWQRVVGMALPALLQDNQASGREGHACQHRASHILR